MSKPSLSANISGQGRVSRPRVLDGAMGTELAIRGAALDGPAWSARAIVERPELCEAIHRDYALAGAEILTAATFRTTKPAFVAWRALDPTSPDPDTWESWLREAVSRARAGARAAGVASARIAGSVAPVADCYRPWETPSDTRAHHRASAEALARAGVDLLLVETFAHEREAIVAVEEALATGRPTWLALTAGPDATLLTPEAIGRVGGIAADLGAETVLVNCTRAVDTARFLEALRGIAAPIGAYANAGAASDAVGSVREVGPPGGPARYAALARGWVDLGATVVGGCCGTSPRHIAELARAFSSWSA